MEEDIDEAATPPGPAGQEEPGRAEEDRPEDEQVEATGEPRVDEALRRLGELGDLPVSEHPPVFERVHASLVDVLGELRSGDDAGRKGDPRQ